ncbi:hypothetical protein NMG60_11032052, partial [Bertholletia excelsa]
MESSLLTLVNCKGETALLIAARHGHSQTVKSLLTFSKTLEEKDPESQRRISMEMMGMTNEEKDTALLEAVRYNHLSVLKLLLEEEPKLADVVNESMETPLYLAAEKDHHKLVEEMLKTCKSPAFTGPDGKTALHAASIRGCMVYRMIFFKEWNILLAKTFGLASTLTKKMDKYGWTPLHHAARREHIEIVKKLLDKDSSTAYISAVEGENETALHLATREGHIEVMKTILAFRPDCWEAVNSRNQNILHMAVESQKKKGIKYILNQWSSILINQKGIDGNTPLDLLSPFGMDVSELITDSPKASTQEQLKKAGTEWCWRNIADWIGRKNWKEDHVRQVLKRRRRDAAKEDIQKYIDKYSSHVIVASLIATVAFAASFTVPGGYYGNEGPEQGMAILARKAAFKAFLITDTSAMMSSSSALFFYFFSSVVAQVDLKYLKHSYVCGFYLNLIALVSMMLAFLTGTAAVLQHSCALM